METYTPEEQAALAPYFTNLDGPVFALVNLPEVVKGALFARYSRSAKSLRRLFLDEFLEPIRAEVRLAPDVAELEAGVVHPRVLVVDQPEAVADVVIRASIGAVLGGAVGYRWMHNMFYTQRVMPGEYNFSMPTGSLPRNGGQLYHSPAERDAAAARRNPVTASAESVRRGGELFSIYCTPCHGTSGKGDGPVSTKFVPPADLTNPDLQKVRTDGYWQSYLSAGGAVMPSYADVDGVPASADPVPDTAPAPLDVLRRGAGRPLLVLHGEAPLDPSGFSLCTKPSVPRSSNPVARDSGASATQGELNSRSKYTAFAPSRLVNSIPSPSRSIARG